MMMSNPDVAKSMSEKSATSALSGETHSSAPSRSAISPAPPRKARSCFVCRSRKVRCDRKSPCGNCKRAGIPCVLPPAERPPRWARRQELITNNAVAASQTAEPGDTDLMERLRYLEGLVKDLRDQLQQARSSYSSSAGPSPGSNPHQDDQSGSHKSPEEAGELRKQFGRMIIQDSEQPRYVSSGFWSRIDDELDGLEDRSDECIRDPSSSSDSETPDVTDGAELNTHHSAFPFQLPSMLSTLELRNCSPLPSQIPFLVEVFSENVYTFLSIVHLPSVKQTIHDVRRGGLDALSSSTEALMFSIYHAAIVSMEDDEVMTNFGESKSKLALQYRYGLERALAKADVLNSPNTTLLQAFAVFVAIARRYESPRYIWMMTGLLVRMAHFIGLQRDGSQFKHLSPFDVEMRRRVWWAVVILDVRSSEDQGTDTIIGKGTFDTRLPLNINDADIDRSAREPPTERLDATNLSSLRTAAKSAHIAIKINSLTGNEFAADDERSKLLDKIYEIYDQEYLRYIPETESSKYSRLVAVARITQGKLTLHAYLPVLLSSPSEAVSQELRAKLLIAAIEVAEFNHALHTDEENAHLRWIWETHTHWYAIVFLLIETSRRSWSPIVERAWTALQSEWLFPRPGPIRSNMRIWVPVRKLMQKARKHREYELERLRQDPLAAASLILEDQQLPSPASPGLTLNDSGVDKVRERWQSLVTPQNGMQTSSDYRSMATGTTDPPKSIYQPGIVSGVSRLDQQQLRAGDGSKARRLPDPIHESRPDGIAQAMPSCIRMPLGMEPMFETSYNDLTTEEPTYDHNLGAWPGFASWLWADIDPSLDDLLGAEMDLDMLNPTSILNNSMHYS